MEKHEYQIQAQAVIPTENGHISAQIRTFFLKDIVSFDECFSIVVGMFEHTKVSELHFTMMDCNGHIESRSAHLGE
jgi:hypothetical protein